jgi:hypothetical protein
MKPTTAEPTTNGAEQAATTAPLTISPAQPLTPRQRQRLAEDEIEAVLEKYNVQIFGVVKTISTANGERQFITWEVAALPDKSKS